MIYTKLHPILHRFTKRSIGPKSLYSAIPLLCLIPPTEEFPCDGLRKNLTKLWLIIGQIFAS